MLELTDERVVPEKMKLTNGLLLEHLARYHFTIPFLHGRVLDFACGSGYGTHIMAKIAKKKVTEVVGIDISEETIMYAKKTYYHPKSSFIVGDVANPNLPSNLGNFDCIVSFETLEHVKQEEQFLLNIYNMLKPGGILILSTPFGQGRGYPTNEPYHVHQLSREEFFNLFPTYDEVNFFYQKGVLVVPKNDSTDYPIGIVVCKK
ncbi:SAM-dependent methyltransferase [Sutcliffiella cohnii]|uniref:SAM-dependent methyltransferase n=1 Tax=Sutcliffiella cohnii TaxID=33932 RepID=A0A223KT87_9BACI|nr:class I SAM-dependent methyltransferase [Sutcliffiella cohnii]AST92564.1 SAM-dependent methyltransferase [Sutcliffiella cohnii]